MLQKIGCTVRVLGTGFVGIIDDQHPVRWHRASAAKALAKAKTILRSGAWDVVVLDESVSAVEEGLLKLGDILSLIRQKPPKVHLALTGHSRYPKIVAASDLVTEMRSVKHPYKTEGMLAQRGVDF